MKKIIKHTFLEWLEICKNKIRQKEIRQKEKKFKFAQRYGVSNQTLKRNLKLK